MVQEKTSPELPHPYAEMQRMQVCIVYYYVLYMLIKSLDRHTGSSLINSSIFA